MSKFYRTALALLWLHLYVGVSEGEPRIIGGQLIRPGDFPYVVQYFRMPETGGGRMCAGTLVNSNTVVTAASCLETTFKVVQNVVVAGTTLHYFNTGENEGVVKKVVKEIPHPDYKKGMKRILTYDVAVLKLESGLPYKYYKDIVLADEDFTNHIQRAVVMGWGQGRSKPIEKSLIEKYPEYFHNLEPVKHSDMYRLHLQGVFIPIAQHHECQRNYPDEFKIGPCHICGAPYDGKGTCMGDNGGPVVWENRLIGVISDNLGCGQHNYAVYFKLTCAKSFIAEHRKFQDVPIKKVLNSTTSDATRPSAHSLLPMVLMASLLLISVLMQLFVT